MFLFHRRILSLPAPTGSLSFQSSRKGTPTYFLFPHLLIVPLRDINHILGPKSGDLLLKQVARRFDQAIDNATTKAWIGGDEFAAILGTPSESEIDAICNAILHTLDRSEE